MEETQVINLDVDGEKVSEYDVEQYLNFDDNTAALNKTVKSSTQAKAILDEMIEANKEYWPELK